MNLDLDAIRAELARRNKIGTHWPDCYLSPLHRDCLAWALLLELERLQAERDRERQRIEGATAELVRVRQRLDRALQVEQVGTPPVRIPDQVECDSNMEIE